MLLLHLVAWGVTLAVGVAFIAANVEVDRIFVSPLGRKRILRVDYSGWPIDCSDRKAILWGPFIAPDLTLHPIRLTFNIVAGLLIVASTFFVFVFPIWRQKLFQVELKSLFILTTSVAVFFALYPVPVPLDHYVFFDDFPLSIQIPLGLGICCAIFWYIWIVIRIGTALIGRLGNKAA